jgi:hypothetical protein
LHSFLAHISAHPHVVLLTVFLVAFLESVAIIGTVVPAAIVMFTAGALIGTGALDLWTTLGIATLGAIAGDGLSYELGARIPAGSRPGELSGAMRMRSRGRSSSFIVTVERASFSPDFLGPCVQLFHWWPA